MTAQNLKYCIKYSVVRFNYLKLTFNSIAISLSIFFGSENRPPENNDNSNVTAFHSFSCGQARMYIFLTVANVNEMREIKRNAMNIV